MRIYVHRCTCERCQAAQMDLNDAETPFAFATLQSPWRPLPQWQQLAATRGDELQERDRRPCPTHAGLSIAH